MFESEYRPAANAVPDAVEQPRAADDDIQSGAVTGEEASSEPEAGTITKSWRDLVAVHPAAKFFPMMPKDELLALGKDIKENGLQEPIVLLKPQDGPPVLPVLLDGRNRLAAIELAFEDPEERTKRLEDALARPKLVDGDVDPDAYVVSANIHRRHLTGEKKRELIDQLLEQHPEWSDRAIADLAKADHKTVGVVRTKKEARGEIPHAEKRTDKTGRKQSAHKTTNSGPPSAKPSSQQVRDEAVVAFAKTFNDNPAKTLADLQAILKDKGDWFGKISSEKKISLAHGFLSVLGVGLDELQGQDSGGQR